MKYRHSKVKKDRRLPHPTGHSFHRIFRRVIACCKPLNLLVPIRKRAFYFTAPQLFFVLFTALLAGVFSPSNGPVSAGSPAAALQQLDDGILAVVGAEGATLYAQPNGAEVGTLNAGDVLSAKARSLDNEWVVVEKTDGESAWATVGSLVLFGTDSLPVAEEVALSEFTAEDSDDGENSSGESEMSALDGSSNITGTAATATATPEMPTTATDATGDKALTASASPTRTVTITDTQPEPSANATAEPVTRATAQRSTSSVDSILGVVRSAESPLYTIPDGDISESLRVGTSLILLGRTEGFDWLNVETDAGQSGWIEASNIVAFRIEGVPVVSVDAAASTLTPESSAAVDSEPPSVEQAEQDSAVQEQSPAESPNEDRSGITGTVSTAVKQLNVRAGPGVGNRVLGRVNTRDSLQVQGRDASGFWLYVSDPTPEVAAGWVSARYVDLDVAVDSFPVVNTTPEAAPTTAAAAGGESVSAGEEADGPTPNQLAVSAAPVGGLTGKLVFQSELGGPIYLYNFSTGALNQIATGMDPSLSPDGQRVTFTRLGANGGVYVVNVDGSNERRIFASDQAPRSPSWSPSGDKIVFSRLTGEYRCTNLGFGICVKNNRFLSGFPKVTKEERGLSVVHLNGENFRDVPALNTANAPQWSSTGIVYHAATSLEITEDSPEDNNRVVVNQVIGYKDPALSPDGERVIFQAQEGTHWEIFAVNRDGSGITALTRPVTTLVDELPSNVSPAWSPNGSSIVYLSNRDENNSAGPWRIWVMNADGSNQRPLPLDVSIKYQYNGEQMVDWGR